MTSRRILSTSVLLIVVLVGQVLAAEPNLFPTDSRVWSRAAEAVVHTDLSKVEPAEAVITGPRLKQKWKAIPFTTAELKGTALSVYGATNPPPVTLALPLARGVHRAGDGFGRI